MKEKNIIQAVNAAGGIDNLDIIDGPRLEAFDAKQLAQALKDEVQRAKQTGWSKVSLHMDLEDALALAKHLE